MNQTPKHKSDPFTGKSHETPPIIKGQMTVYDVLDDIRRERESQDRRLAGALTGTNSIGGTRIA